MTENSPPISPRAKARRSSFIALRRRSQKIAKKIGAYSVADGIGVRLADTPTGYIGWLFLLESPIFFAIFWDRRRNAIKLDRRAFALGLIGGLFSVIAYAVVLYAKTIAPLGAVSAVRESSVIIAAMIGLIFFGERPVFGRLLSAAIVAAGVIALAAS